MYLPRIFFVILASGSFSLFAFPRYEFSEEPSSPADLESFQNVLSREVPDGDSAAKILLAAMDRAKTVSEKMKLLNAAFFSSSDVNARYLNCVLPFRYRLLLRFRINPKDVFSKIAADSILYQNPMSDSFYWNLKLSEVSDPELAVLAAQIMRKMSIHKKALEFLRYAYRISPAENTESALLEHLFFLGENAEVEKILAERGNRKYSFASGLVYADFYGRLGKFAEAEKILAGLQSHSPLDSLRKTVRLLECFSRTGREKELAPLLIQSASACGSVTGSLKKELSERTMWVWLFSGLERVELSNLWTNSYTSNMPPFHQGNSPRLQTRLWYSVFSHVYRNSDVPGREKLLAALSPELRDPIKLLLENPDRPSLSLKLEEKLLDGTASESETRFYSLLLSLSRRFPNDESAVKVMNILISKKLPFPLFLANWLARRTVSSEQKLQMIDRYFAANPSMDAFFYPLLSLLPRLEEPLQKKIVEYMKKQQGGRTVSPYCCLALPFLLKSKDYETFAKILTGGKSFLFPMSRIPASCGSGASSFEQFFQQKKFLPLLTDQMEAVGLLTRTAIDKGELWKQVPVPGLSAMANLFIACWTEHPREAKEMLHKIADSNEKKDVYFFLNLMSFADYLKENAILHQAASALFFAEKVPVDAKDFAAFFLFKAASARKDDAVALKAAEYLLAAYPNTESLSFLLKNSANPELKKQLPKRLVPGKIQLNFDFFTRFAENYRKNPEKTYALLKQYMDNVLPSCRQPGNSSAPYGTGGAWENCLSNLRNSDPDRKLLTEVLNRMDADASLDPLIPALFCEKVMEDLPNALVRYRKILDRNPRDPLMLAKLFQLTAVSDPASAKKWLVQLSELPVSRWNLIFNGSDVRPVLLAVETLMKQPYPKEAYSLMLNALEMYRRGISGVGNASSLFYGFEGDVSPEPRRIDLYRILAEQGLNRKELRGHAVSACLKMARMGWLPPASFKNIAKEVYRADGMVAGWHYEDYFLSCYLKDGPEEWRAFAAKEAPRLKKYVEFWDRLGGCKGGDVLPVLREIAQKDLVFFQREVFPAWLTIAVEQKKSFDLLGVLTDPALSSCLNSWPFPSQKIKEYLNRQPMDENVRFFRNASRWLVRQNNLTEKDLREFNRSGFLASLKTGAPLASCFPMHFWGTKPLTPLQKAQIRAACISTSDFLFLSDNLFSAVFQKRDLDLFALFQQTPLMESMRKFRVKGTWKDQYVDENLKSVFQRRLSALPHSKRTFGMEILAARFSRSRADFVTVFEKYSAEWFALNDMEKVRLLEQCRKLFDRPENFRYSNPALRNSLRKIGNLLNLREFNYYMSLTSPGNNSWPLMNEMFGLLEYWILKDPVRAEKLLEKMRTLCPNESRVYFRNLGYRPLHYRMYRLLHRNGVPAAPRMRRTEKFVNALLTQAYRESGPDGILELRQILPGVCSERALFFFLLGHREMIGKADVLKKFEDALARSPKSSDLRTAVAVLRSAGMNPMNPDDRTWLSSNMKNLLKNSSKVSLSELEKLFPELFFDPSYRKMMFASKIAALNRRTGNNPEKDPDSYLRVICEGMEFRAKLPPSEFRKLLSPLMKNSLETFPVLKESDARKVLPFLLSYVLSANDRENLEQLREYTDLISPEYLNSVEKSRFYGLPEKEAMRKIFGKSAH